MRSIADTIARLVPHPATPPTDRLVDLDARFDNPGDLRALVHVPRDLAPGGALVVVLHGCTQTAAGYDHASGWSQLADEHGFALLYPEQVRANNANRCFNWFLADDVARGHGEVASVAAMIDATVAAHALDPARVFVTGLSAGGAMAGAMLAAYPDRFAGGAIVAGLPYGVAGSVPQALERMRGQGLPDAATLTALVRRAGPTPTRRAPVTVWHGSADATVVPAAGEAVVAQWLGAHGVADRRPEDVTQGGHRHRIWRDAGGRAVVEAHTIAGMGHGTPIDPAVCGAAAPFMLDVGIPSTALIAASWGLAPAPVARPQPARPAASVPSYGANQVIEDALRAAGLMR